ncbi:MAG: hypothetical protein WBF81_01790 [Thermoplasmata archaeon]
MSENGPREGTRDLPRAGPDSGRRAVDEDSLAAAAYGSLARSLRRRRAELIALLESGEPPEGVAVTYRSDHPLESAVTTDEVDAALAESKVRALPNGGPVQDRSGGRARRPRPRA